MRNARGILPPFVAPTQTLIDAVDRTNVAILSLGSDITANNGSDAGRVLWANYLGLRGRWDVFFQLFHNNDFGTVNGATSNLTAFQAEYKQLRARLVALGVTPTSDLVVTDLSAPDLGGLSSLFATSSRALVTVAVVAAAAYFLVPLLRKRR